MPKIYLKNSEIQIEEGYWLHLKISGGEVGTSITEDFVYPDGTYVWKQTLKGIPIFSESSITFREINIEPDEFNNLKEFVASNITESYDHGGMYDVSYEIDLSDGSSHIRIENDYDLYSKIRKHLPFDKASSKS
ncbi:MAG: hypothetical protein WC243_02745 [Patescibacteria group bacterium]|jgi:hypothetical protein